MTVTEDSRDLAAMCSSTQSSHRIWHPSALCTQPVSLEMASSARAPSLSRLHLHHAEGVSQKPEHPRDGTQSLPRAERWPGTRPLRDPPKRPGPRCPLPSSGARSSARTFLRLTASLRIGQVGKLGPRGPQRPCPPGCGRPVRAAPLRCEKGQGPSDKALGPPHTTATAEALSPPDLPQPCPEAGVLRGMNFTTRSLWFHYEFPDPGQHPRPPGPRLHI
ncbi:unnamed protein product [Rangifer tarandus platyrhynchus]|uniref:Uncharacterized protein n=1 Tax=Rangifer tarandus platyrhynchus TaxID=3082113 RepID=A0AC59YV41_RANTA